MKKQPNSRIFLTLVSLGASLEYYDFVVYAMLSPYLNRAFFPDSQSEIPYLHTLGLFSVGYIARPFGGILFGSLGDRFGRRVTFVSVMLLMTLSTLLIGLLPTYSQIGAISGLLLILLRFFQGLSFGGELPGAITVVSEQTSPNKYGFHCGIIMSSVAFGSILASLVLQLLSRILTEEEILRWGWRCPFLFGGVLAIVSFAIRVSMQETRSARKPGEHRIPIISLFKFHPLEVLLGSAIVLFPSALIVFMLYIPEYFSKYFNYALPDIYFSNTFSLLWAACCLPVFGLLSDRIGPTRILMATSFLFCLFIFPMFELVSEQSVACLALFLILIQTFIAALVTSYLPLLVTLFPESVRFTGIAFCYNIAYVLAGLTPGLFNFFLSKNFSHNLIFTTHFMTGVVALFSIIQLNAVRKRKYLRLSEP